MKNHRILLVFSLGILFLITACGQNATTPTQGTSPIPQNASNNPNASSPYGSPAGYGAGYGNAGGGNVNWGGPYSGGNVNWGGGSGGVNWGGPYGGGNVSWGE